MAHLSTGGNDLSSFSLSLLHFPCSVSFFFKMSLLLSLSVVFIEVSKSFVSFFIYSLLTKALLSFKKINNNDQENIVFIFVVKCFPALFSFAVAITTHTIHDMYIYLFNTYLY